MIKALFKTSSVYFSGLLISKVLTTLTFILLARQFVPELFGHLVFYTTLLSVLTFIGDFGLVQWFQKKAHDESHSRLISHMMTARVFTLIGTILLSLIIFSFKPYFSPFITILFIINLIPEAFLSVFDGYYLFNGKTSYVGLKVGAKMLIILIALLLYGRNFTLEIALLWHVAASSIIFLWYIPWDKISAYTSDSIKNVKATLHSSSTYGLLILSSLIYSRGDALVIGTIASSYGLGIYSTAYRYLDSISLLPTALAHNLFPISSKKEGITGKQLINLTCAMFLIGLCCAVTIFFLASFLTIFLLGDNYADAIPILQIFTLVIFLLFINSPLSTVVQSSKYIKKFIPYGIANTLLNIGLNIALIPQYGIAAAAWNMVVTEVTGLIINIYFIKKIYTTIS